jgi:hypothetical protein
MLISLINKVKGRLGFPPKTKSPSGATRGAPPPKMVPFFHKMSHLKYAKYDSTRASGEFMRGTSGQMGKTRKSVRNQMLVSLRGGGVN